MLICHEDSLIQRETIFLIEEDAYNFKKNVITYSNNELIDLEKFLKINNVHEISNFVISEIINEKNGQSFTAFKSTHQTVQNYYSLILKIALKLPFIRYSPSQKELINLSLEIEKSVSKQDAIIYKRIIESDVEWTESNIYQKVEKIWGNLT